MERHTRGALPDVALPRVRLMRADAATDHSAVMTELMLCLVLQGEKEMVCGANAFTYDDGCYFVATVEIPVMGRVSRASRQHPFLCIGLDFNPVVLAELIAEMPRADDPELMCGLGISAAEPELREAFLRLIRLFDNPDEASILGPLIEREILFRLLRGPQGAKLRQIGKADSRQTNLRRALAWIRDNYTQSFMVEDLARIAGMSVSVFHRHFKTATGMTPIQYQKRFRLYEARRRLLENSKDAASVAFAVGYESASQFSREYARMFGAPPARDAARNRLAID